MSNLDHSKTYVFDAMKNYHQRKVIPFDVPGHKHGRGLREYAEYFGSTMLELDVNSMKPLDFLGNPTSVIRQAEDLLADAFGADRAYFIVNGTSFAVQVMLMTTVTVGDKIILPRNVHKSVINGLILCGALPVYMEPEIDMEMGVSHNITLDSLKKAYNEHPDAKAVFIINPTYYGATCDLKSVVDFCHQRSMYVLVDEAHGAHFKFNEKFPISAMEAGADMSAVSLHKTGGSLTQTSALLANTSRIKGEYIRKIINLMQTTSPSYLLMGSIDVARKMLVMEGHCILEKLWELSIYARNEINKIPGYYSIGLEAEGRPGIYRFDPTKLSITTRNMGINGMELYDILRDEYNIQMETGDFYNSLAILSVGDNCDCINILISSLRDISQRFTHQRLEYKKIDLHYPEVVITPKEAFYSEQEMVLLEDSLGRISSESIMSYPPGIPVVSYGERINQSAIEQIKLFKASHSMITGMDDSEANFIKVVKE
ncbi:MAG: aminotransferase class I/II-fold pyridoxal phosphate-dependent enzyme [Peptostreptococcales bacterium]